MEETNKIQVLERALERQKAARREAEKILEKKSYELYNISQELKTSNFKLQELLSEKTSELEGVFINIIDAYIVMDLDANVIKMNKAAIEMLGYDVDKELFNLMELLKEEYLEYTKKSYEKLNKEGVLTNYQAVVITKNNQEKLVQVNASIIYNKLGVPIAAQGILRDITTENANKQLIEDQKKQLDIIIDHSPIGISLSRKDDKGLLKANPSLCKMLGYTSDEFINIKLQDLTHDHDKEISELKRNELYSHTVDSYFLEKRYVRKNGKTMWAKTSVTGVKSLLNEVKFHVTTIEDITIQKNLENQKEQLLKSLESQNEQLNEYAHIVSHDLKSPLRSISALLSWTKEDFEDKLGEESLFNLNLMEDKVEKMDKLISDILSYSSIEDEGMNTSNVDVNTVINDIVDIIYIPEHIKVVIKNKLPTLKADATRLQQLFQNLISNAINYIDKEKGLVEIDFKETKEFVVFSIKDNGVGIEEKYHKTIFKIFNKLGDYEKATGIGLSIVKKVIELYKGEIWLESEVGIGTTFFFSIKK